MDYVIETENIVKVYRPKTAVNNVSMHVKRGDIYGLIGRNGAGKTTLMKMILGLTVPTAGNVVLFGGENLTTARMRIGSLIEAPGLYKNCTAYENMLRFSILYGADKSEIQPLLDKVGLGDVKKKTAGEFSLGMRQRLGIAIALLAHPEIMILDEPINGLDPAGIKDVRDTIIALNKEGVTFLISSHLLDELAKVVTCYGIISDGVLVEEITAEELERQCGQYVKIVTTQAEETVKLLKERFGGVEPEIKPDGVYLYSHLDMTVQIIEYLVTKGIPVSQLSIFESGFEDFFISRIGK